MMDFYQLVGEVEANYALATKCRLEFILENNKLDGACALFYQSFAAGGKAVMDGYMNLSQAPFSAIEQIASGTEDWHIVRYKIKIIIRLFNDLSSHM